MAAPKKHIVFDVIGTLQLRAEGIKPLLFGYACHHSMPYLTSHIRIETAEREYAYLSVSSTTGYTPFYKAFAPLFYRVLWMFGISTPREFASDEDKDFIIQSFTALRMRPGAAECISHLCANGFTVWGYTAGDVATVGQYFADAGIEMLVGNLLSCDMYGVGKPDKESYRPVLEMLRKEGEDGELWFAAAHMWDVSAATKSGFKGAWCSVLEKEPCLEIFGEMDVMADSLPEMARMVVEKAKGRGRG
ncbi:hypothetical protein LCER1_G005423 [Lachnellula cervina]|uniref:(S)-2-haloacid dehalogenase 4A n=1 Tax=Lachnellula cervina TaxID=1316786 RepID=A0A7D8Z142_9HELO|nr:hypothetical protein LCER1_G005423 [Lachnellula cervina]